MLWCFFGTHLADIVSQIHYLRKIGKVGIKLIVGQSFLWNALYQFTALLVDISEIIIERVFFFFMVIGSGTTPTFLYVIYRKSRKFSYHKRFERFHFPFRVGGIEYCSFQ